ncbi:4465_t:CDS:2, partial [Entrophospora sp. SA101]
MVDYIFTVSTFVSVILILIPLGFHIQLRNSGAILMTMWISITNFILFVNSILWADDLEDKAPTWCYITPPIYVAAHVGLMASITCMIYNLYSYVEYPTIITEVYKRRQIYTELFISIVMPFVLTALGYLVFKNKYSIRPILGCFLQAHSSWLYILLLGIWPVIISGIGCYLAARTSYTILKKRLEIQALLTYCESGLNASRFYRLVLFCITFLILALPATLLTVLGNLNNGLLPYDFYEVHKNWNTIMRFTAETGGLSVLDYAKPLTGLFVFLFFGTGQDAMNSYRKFGLSIKLDKIFPCCFRERTISPTDTASPNSKTYNGKMMTSVPKQANFDLTSGIKFNIEGIDTTTIMSITNHRDDDDFDYDHKINYSSSTLAVNSSYNNTIVASTPTSYRSHFYERNDDNLNHIDDLLAVYPPDIAISRSHNSNIGEEDYNNNNANYHRESGIDNLPGTSSDTFDIENVFPAQ